MAKAKKKKKSSRRASRKGSRRGLWAFLTVVLVVAGIMGAFMALKGESERPIAFTMAGTAGHKGSGKGELETPSGIGIAPNGDVLVADRVNSRVQRFGADGQFKLAFGKPTVIKGKAKLGELEEPSGVAVDGQDNAYVADAWNGRIQKFDPKGKAIAEFGGVRYSFYSPRNVIVDKNGNLYVADTGNSMVKVIDASGRLLKSIGSKGSGAGLFNEVFGLAVDSKGNLYAADPGNKRIEKFGPGPGFAFLKDKKIAGWQLNAPTWPHLCVDAQDHVIVVDSGGRKLWVYDADLNYLGTVGAPAGMDGTSAPLGVAAAADGSVWLSDAGSNRLEHLGPLNIPAKK